MEKEKYRSVIRFSFLSGKACEEIKPIIDGIYGTHSVYGTLYHWLAKFRNSVFDKSPPNDPKPATTEKTARENHARDFGHEKIVCAMGTKSLHPQENKRNRELTSTKTCLPLFNRNPK